MNWLSRLLKRGIYFSKTIPWPGEKGLKPADPYKKVTKQEVMDEIRKKEK